MDVSLFGQIFRVSEKLMTQVVHFLSEIDTMVTNMTGSSILKSTGHTGWVKPVKLSVRFILGDGEQNSDDFSESESEIIESDSDDDWESCVSLVEEDECFYDAVSLDDSSGCILFLFSHQVNELTF